MPKPPHDEEEATKLHDLSLAPSFERGKQRASPSFLVVSGQSSAGKMFKLSGQMLIGRTTAAEIYLDDEGVSRKHAQVTVGPDGSVIVSDLGSTNGTYYNGQRIASHVLRDGDTIQIGSATILKFSYRDALEEALQQNLYDSATRDGLTKAYNKKYFGDAIRKEFAYAARQQSALTLVMFDVDHFKRINDQYGHPAGDHVLATISRIVSGHIRAEDTFARYGGEEFALILRETTEQEGVNCAERIRQTLERTAFDAGGVRVPVTMSFGVATFTGTELQAPEQLIAAADMYLYRAKRSGRNRVEARLISGP